MPLLVRPAKRQINKPPHRLMLPPSKPLQLPPATLENALFLKSSSELGSTEGKRRASNPLTKVRARFPLSPSHHSSRAPESFDHGSAQNIGIITQFICDTLTNKCKANAAAKATCTKAQAAAAAAPPKTGADADAFNAVFGIKTNFAAVSAVDDQGRIVGRGFKLVRRF